jgi:hypothetical protein
MTTKLTDAMRIAFAHLQAHVQNAAATTHMRDTFVVHLRAIVSVARGLLHDTVALSDCWQGSRLPIVLLGSITSFLQTLDCFPLLSVNRGWNRCIAAFQGVTQKLNCNLQHLLCARKARTWNIASMKQLHILDKDGIAFTSSTGVGILGSLQEQKVGLSFQDPDKTHLVPEWLATSYTPNRSTFYTFEEWNRKHKRNRYEVDRTKCPLPKTIADCMLNTEWMILQTKQETQDVTHVVSTKDWAYRLPVPDIIAPLTERPEHKCLGPNGNVYFLTQLRTPAELARTQQRHVSHFGLVEWDLKRNRVCTTYNPQHIWSVCDLHQSSICANATHIYVVGASGCETSHCVWQGETDDFFVEVFTIGLEREGPTWTRRFLVPDNGNEYDTGITCCVNDLFLFVCTLAGVTFVCLNDLRDFCTVEMADNSFFQNKGTRIACRSGRDRRFYLYSPKHSTRIEEWECLFVG